MTAVRDFNAPRNARFWNQAVVSIVCDGKHPDGRGRSVRDIDARLGRQSARAQGWAVAVKNPNGRRRLDFCPEHETGEPHG